MTTDPISTEPERTHCDNCLKTLRLCVCDSIVPLKTKLHVIFLQHPQEPDKDLGTAWIAHKSLPNSTFKIGLSWPNLAKVLGRAADPKKWLVLYIGSAQGKSTLTLVDKKGQPSSIQVFPKDLEGIVVLDGTWSQAKTLWWRNAWLLKLQRVVLRPPKISLYGKLRKEPKRDGVSTIEAVAYTLAELQNEPELVDKLTVPFVDLLKKFRD